ncbi:MAG: sulfotransferase, partial [Rhodanobacteraceae bacterium]
ALMRVGETVAARASLAHPVLARTQEPQWLSRLADFRQRLNEHAESLALIERAVAKGASGPEIHFHHGVQLYFNGRLSAAKIELEKSFRLAPAAGRTALSLSRLHRQTARSNHLDVIAEGLARVAKGTIEHAALEFARYKELEDLGRFDEAWQALEHGNALMSVRNLRGARGEQSYLAQLIATPLPERLRDPSADETGPAPIFILGLPRSGTTVLERMLANHPRVASAGELVDFGMQLYWAADTSDIQNERFLSRLLELDFVEVGRRYLARTQWRARGKPFFIDKQPPNWALAGFIHLALPHARILHLVRDPMDVCFSNWRTFFGDSYAYSYELAALATQHRIYRGLMRHWHATMPGVILDVSYADLVRQPEAVMRRVLQFCGLEFEPRCLDMQANRTPVATLSAAQVREPLHDNAFAEWKLYAVQLDGLRRALQAADEATLVGGRTE